MADPGEGPAPPPLIFRPKGGPKGRKRIFLETAPPPPPYLRIWMTWPPLPKGLDPSMHYICTFIPAITPTLSTVTLVKALDNVAVRIEQMVTPIIIQPTANSRAATDFGVLSPYLRKIMHLKFLMKKFKMALLP